MADLKIAMLAPENAGKTTYLAALYGVLMERNTDPDYPLRFHVSDPATKGTLDGYFEALALRGAYPKKTTQQLDISLSVSSRSTEQSVSLQLMDFAGRLIRGVREEGDEEEYDDLIKSLSQCHGYILLLDAGQLAHTSRYRRQHSLAIADVEQVISGAAKAGDKGLMDGRPLVFGLSKLDSLVDADAAGGASSLERCIDNAQEHFRGYFDGSGPLVPMLCGVSMWDESGEGGEFSPYNVGLALDYCVGMAVRGLARSHFAKVEALEKDRQSEKRWVDNRKRKDWIERIYNHLK